MSDVVVLSSGNPHVALIQLNRPPYNYVDADLLEELADLLERIDSQDEFRATVLCSEGKAFCAGAQLNSNTSVDARGPDPAVFYKQALRFYGFKKPLIAAVHGAAVGAGLGLAVAADFRVACASAKFVANFNRLGFHPGFGLSYTLPHLIGQQQASEMFYTGRRVGGQEALALGLIDRLVDAEQVIPAALELASQIALSAPRAVVSTRATLRRNWVKEVNEVIQIEVREQRSHMEMEDFAEGIKAMAERRVPIFKNR